MNELQIMTFKGVRGYVDVNDVVQLNLEDVARGLGFTSKTVSATSGREYVNVRWSRVARHLVSFGILNSEKDDLPEYIAEPIFYLFSMKAENETAKAFQHTIAYDVLPAIRKHGAYMTPATIEKILDDPDTIIRLATSLKNEREKRRALEARAEADRPKVLFADSVTASKSSILVGEMAKLLKQNGVHTGQNRLFETLREKGFLIRRQGTDYNMPTQKSMELGLFEIKETVINHSDGHTSVSKTPKITGKGQQYFVNMFLGRDAPGV